MATKANGVRVWVMVGLGTVGGLGTMIGYNTRSALRHERENAAFMVEVVKVHAAIQSDVRLIMHEMKISPGEFSP